MRDYLAPLRRERRLHAGLSGETVDERARAMDLVLAARVAPGPGERALDVGCGAGFLVRDIEACFDGVVATGIDLDAGLAPLVVGDACALPFEDASFDVVLAQESLSWIDGLPAAMREIRRVLHPGGRLAIGDFVFAHPRHAAPWRAVNRLTLVGWRALLEAHGLEPGRVTDHSAAAMQAYWRLYNALPRAPADTHARRRRNLGRRISAMKAGHVRRIIITARKP